MTRFERNMFARDLAAYTARNDARRAENATRRARAQVNAELCAVLLADARRRGQSEIGWADYFRNAGIA